MSSLDEYFMDENNTVRNTLKNPVLHSPPHFYSVGKKDYFALDVDISPSLSAICELIGLLRSKKVMGAYHVMS